MSRTLALSGLLSAAVLATAGGQTPPAVKKDQSESKPVYEQFVTQHVRNAPAKGSLEEAIALAMQNNPDVRVAEAEAQVAQAKVAQARLAVTQKVTAARLDRQKATNAVKAAEAQLVQGDAVLKAAAVRYERLKQVNRANGVSQLELDAAEADVRKSEAAIAVHRGAVEAAKAEVALAEAALTAITGGMSEVKGVAFSVDGNTLAVERAAPHSVEFALRDVATPRYIELTLDLSRAAPPGSVADKLKAALDKPVKLPEQKDVHLEPLFAALFKAAGPDVRVKLPMVADPKLIKEAVKISMPAGELPLGAWLELIGDEVNQWMAAFEAPPAGWPKRYGLYVREYGLLMAGTETAPADAVSVSAFWKQARAAAAKSEAKK